MTSKSDSATINSRVITMKQPHKKKLSVFGFGTYRFENTSEHKNLLKQAINKGITLIDTAPNYQDGKAETAIGNVLEELLYENKLSRETLTIISKAGFLEGNTYEKYAKKYHSITHLPKNAGYCIEPEFLETQLSESLKRLNLDFIDGYLLQNPETFFNEEKKSDTYYQNLKLAFEYLETEVANGRIKYYGISSNTFEKNQRNHNSISLAKLIEILDLIPNHHFKYIQCPFNLIENDHAKNDGGASFFETAQAHGFEIITNRPLNAIVNQQLVKLVDLDTDSDITEIEIQDLLEAGVDNESALSQLLADKEIPNLTQLTTLFEKLNEIFSNQITFFTYQELLERVFLPQVDKLMASLETLNLDPSIESQLLQYFSLFNHTAKEISNYYKQVHQTTLIELKSSLQPYIDTNLPIHTLCLQTYKHTHSISATLVGIRTQEQLDSVIDNLNHSILKDLKESFLWDTINFNTLV